MIDENTFIPISDALRFMQKGIMQHTTYFGIKTLKNPLDAWVYQEIIWETRPDVIIEIGNASGGSALMLAHLCDLIGKGSVIALDLSHSQVGESAKMHPRIVFIEGDACKNYETVKGMLSPDSHVLVIEDSSHTYENTLGLLREYSQLIKSGDYYIIEDSICHHGLDEGPSPGPYEAIETFLSENKDFYSDRNREHFFITWNPKGYLRRR